jgi:DNA-binding MltR family transcriptional regulator
MVEIDKNDLFRESDRGCVLILSSDVENQLEDILKSWFDNSSDLSTKEYKNIFDFTGPLGSLSSKISICKAIGIINSSLHSDLHKIRSIRNEAAHSKESFSLSDEKIKQLILSMEHNYLKKKQITRYSLCDQSGKKIENTEATHEVLMKARGLLRVDKVNFILTVKDIQLKLRFIEGSSSVIGKSIKGIRNKYEDLFTDFIASNKDPETNIKN